MTVGHLKIFNKGSNSTRTGAKGPRGAHGRDEQISYRFEELAVARGRSLISNPIVRVGQHQSERRDENGKVVPHPGEVADG